MNRAPVKTLLFHSEIGIPPDILQRIRRIGQRSLYYSSHAVNAAITDNLGSVQLSQLPEKVNIASDEVRVIEVEVNLQEKFISKIVLRIPFSTRRDLVVVIATRDWVVKTVWTNSVNDCHKSLDRSRYCTPEKYYEQRKSYSM